MEWISRIWLSCLALGAAMAQTAVEREWSEQVLPVIEHYCYDCHGDGVEKGDLSLDQFREVEDLRQQRDLWLEVEKHIALRLMPPLDEPQMAAREQELVLDWIDRALFRTEQTHAGPRLIRRLNGHEYENTVNELLGTELELKELLPPDDTGYGFDNISAVLTISPTHMDKFYRAAEVALEASMREEQHGQLIEFPEQVGGVGRTSDGLYIYRQNGKIFSRVTVEEAGEYEISFVGYGRQERFGPLVRLYWDGVKVKSFFITQPLHHADREVRRVRRVLEAGEHELCLSLENRNKPYAPKMAEELFITEVQVSGPLAQQRGGHYASLYELGTIAEAVERFMTRAWRRAVTEQELARYLALAEAAEGTRRDQLREVYLAVLLSPQFLYRELSSSEAGLADEYTLASRLSYFLWSSMPDEELLSLAASGRLREELDAQVERMLSSERVEHFVADFLGQWLQLRDVPLVSPSRAQYPDFDWHLLGDMRKETEYLLRYILHHNLPLMEMMTADYTFLNKSLAEHYRYVGLRQDGFKRVQVPLPERYGILGHASFLALTSHPDRTSPVLRGKYVMENLLGIEPPPAPQNANQVVTESSHHSLRLQLEQHRQDPSCASCHALMDPIGFGLEQFDALGQWRSTYEDGQPIMTHGVLYRGEIFAGVEQMREHIVTQYATEFYHSAIQNLLIYATGRGLEWYDRQTVEQIYADSQQLGFRDIIKAVVHSVPFQYVAYE